MKRAAGIAALSITLAACATAEGYRQQNSLFIGGHSDALIVELGQPQSRDTLSDGSEVWGYYREVRREISGRYRSIPHERTVTYRDKDGRERTRTERYEETVYEPPQSWLESCETRFVVSPHGVVTELRFDGAACVAEEIY